VTTTTDGTTESPQFVVVHQNDPLASPLLDDLQAEYSGRYGASAGPEYVDLRAYPAEEFAPPDGVLVVGLSDGVPVAGGAFRRYDPSTAELKRIWTASTHRRRGYGRLVVAELERIALQRGYSRVYLTTGWRQPEAVALYLAMGYTALYDPSLRAEDVGPHPFEKHLVDKGASRGFHR
jgi:GNAT superfamily N-acetyltransferase